jgi:hypothetical protein
MATQDRLTYIGELWAVTVEEDGREKFMEVSPAVLGAARGLGLVTTDSRRELQKGQVHSRPRSGRPKILRTVWYYRPRRSGQWWRHETPRALIWFDGVGPGDLPYAYLDSRGSVPCGVEDFICN